MDLIKCPVCGEMYSSSYPSCPFCEEDGEQPRKLAFRPRHRIADKTKARSARGGLIAVLVLVLGLLGWYLFGGSGDQRADKPQNSAPLEQTNEPNVPASNTHSDPLGPGGEDAGDQTGGGEDAGDQTGGGDTEPDDQTQQSAPEVIDADVDVSGAQINRSDFTLSGTGDSYRVKLSGTEATPRWSIDNANVATIGSDGTVTAVANGTTTLRCAVGTRELTCIVRVVSTGKTAAPAEAPTVAPVASTTPAQTETTPAQTGTDAASGSDGTHVDASSLSVRTNYGTVLQKDPGTGYPDCTVRIGGDPISLNITGTDVPVSSWTSDKTSVVTVDASGHLTPVSAGTAHVTATVGDATITCIIRVR